MTRSTNARIAGATFLAYIGVAYPSVSLFDRATSASDTAGKLAGIAAHAGDVRIAILLGLVSCFTAIVLAVTLYGVTRSEDHELSMFGLCCRLVEGMLGGPQLVGTVFLLTIATNPEAADVTGSHAIAAFLFRTSAWVVLVAGTFFAVGSTAFAWLLLHGRMIPAWLAWLGLGASILLVVCLPLRLAGYLPPLGMTVWLPMAAFEIPLGVYFLVKGVRPADAQRAASPALV